MAKKEKPCIPLIYTKGITDCFPNVIQQIDKQAQTSEVWQKLYQGGPLDTNLLDALIKAEFQKHGNDWPIMKEGRKYWNRNLDMRDPYFFENLHQTDLKLLAISLSWISPVVAWRPYKQIYAFSKEISEVLIAQKDANMDIPAEILKNIPYPCAYFDAPFEEKLKGFFIHLDCREEGKLYLCISFIAEHPDEPDQISYNGYAELEIKEGSTIAKEIDIYTTKVWGSLPAHFMAEYGPSSDKHGNMSYAEQNKGILERASIALQFILYVCAKNAEIKPDERHKSDSKNRTHKKPIKDVYREVRTDRAGDEFALTVRKMQKQNYVISEKNPDAHGSPKSPHIRVVTGIITGSVLEPDSASWC